MLSVILQLGGLGNLIIGITTAAAAGNAVNDESKKCKFEFWYLWRNGEVSATAWRNLRK